MVEKKKQEHNRMKKIQEKRKCRIGKGGKLKKVNSRSRKNKEKID